MDIRERIESFSTLGAILRDSLEGKQTKYSERLHHLIETQHLKNAWFTPDNVRLAIKSIAEQLTNENLTKWTDAYPGLQQSHEPLTVGVIMAGNRPLVGFHDLLSVLITGNRLMAKPSSKDPDLIRFTGDILCDINKGFSEKIKFAGDILSGFDAIIATGSDNTSRYFDYYFGRYPNIIRRNRSSIGILTGNETDMELRDLGLDVFSYFGLGCRNISKVFVPSGYDLTKMTGQWGNYSGLINHSKYANNYDFNKAVYLVNKEKFTDTGFLLVKEDRGLSSPLAVLWFEYYNSPRELTEITGGLREKIQCITGKGFIPFGKSQSTALWDYADGVDTIEFLLKKNSSGIF